MLYYKSLAEEKFRWPRPGDELMSLTGQQINWLPLLEGAEISTMSQLALWTVESEKVLAFSV